MKTNKKQIWFPAKKYGWGWGPPCTWQGWVVMAAWLVLLGGGGFLIAPRSVGSFVFYAVILSIGLFSVCLTKGEKPRWRWGKD
jgi:hypothetical protein